MALQVQGTEKVSFLSLPHFFWGVGVGGKILLHTKKCIQSVIEITTVTLMCSEQVVWCCLPKLCGGSDGFSFANVQPKINTVSCTPHYCYTIHLAPDTKTRQFFHANPILRPSFIANYLSCSHQEQHLHS